MNNFIYADNAATTKISPEVFEAMTPYLTEFYGNTSSLYKIGRENHKVKEEARRKIAIKQSLKQTFRKPR